MKIIVVGGSGHLGALAVKALRRDASITVLTAGRRAIGDGAVRVDLADPATFAAVDGADVVVDVADTTTTAPDALAARPEALAVAGLPEVLEQAFPSIFDTSARNAGAVTPSAQILNPRPPTTPPRPPPPRPQPRPDLAAVRLTYGQSVNFVAWAYQTKVYWASWGPHEPTDCVSLKAGYASAQINCSGYKLGSWYGQSVTIKNYGNGAGIGNELLVNVY